jgi:hypothetical protein
MQPRPVDFIKGHMGGNRILLLDGEQLDRERLLSQSLRALDDLCLAGHQAGILYPPERGGTVRARIASVCGRDFIPACGGFTQVISRALVETPLGERFRPEERDGVRVIRIEFDSLDVQTEVAMTDGRFDHVTTDFTSFAHNLLLRGFERVDLGGLYGWRAGHFFVLDAEQVRRKHPEVNFETMDDTTKQLITLLQYRFLGATALTSWDFALYDANTDGLGDIRVVFPHNVRIGFIEPSCGTGSIALTLALLSNGDFRHFGTLEGGVYTVQLQTGGKPVLGGTDLTTVRVEKPDDGEIGRVTFSNSNVELLASGQITL